MKRRKNAVISANLLWCGGAAAAASKRTIEASTRQEPPPAESSSLASCEGQECSSWCQVIKLLFWQWRRPISRPRDACEMRLVTFCLVQAQPALHGEQWSGQAASLRGVALPWAVDDGRDLRRRVLAD